MAEVKISALPVANTLSPTDRVVVLVNPSGAASVRTITFGNVTNLTRASIISNTAPASNTANGVPGQLAYDATSLYVCIANNRWGKATLDLSW